MRIETILNGKLSDINPIFFGYENNPNLLRRGPTIRNHTLVHFVKSGSGYFERNGKTYRLTAGEVFIIPPGEVTSYMADKDDPWELIWVGFDGELSLDFCTLPHVFKASPEIFEEINGAHKAHGRKDILVSCILMKWYYELFPESNDSINDYAGIVKKYIKNNYMMPLKVTEIAEMMHLHRSHLLRLFKEKTGMTIQEYLIEIRLNEAKRLLLSGKNVTEAALCCGFGNPSHFSKIYKKYYGIAPKNARKNFDE